VATGLHDGGGGVEAMREIALAQGRSRSRSTGLNSGRRRHQREVVGHAHGTSVGSDLGRHLGQEADHRSSGEGGQGKRHLGPCRRLNGSKEVGGAMRWPREPDGRMPLIGPRWLALPVWPTRASSSKHRPRWRRIGRPALALAPRAVTHPFDLDKDPTMPETRQRPQITLVTPPEIELSTFPALLGRVLDGAPVACLRLALHSRDEDRAARAADALREIAHARDIPLVLQGDAALARRLGLDGLHLLDAQRSVRRLRKELGPDAILGTHCAASRHDGMEAAEWGADYVSFGPAGVGGVAAHDLFAWWSEMIEVPVVAEGGLDEATVADLAPVTDFFALGPEIWNAPDPARRLRALAAAIG
jgi:thiamine-phosphate pyrophosphorylase